MVRVANGKKRKHPAGSSDSSDGVRRSSRAKRQKLLEDGFVATLEDGDMDDDVDIEGQLAAADAQQRNGSIGGGGGGGGPGAFGLGKAEYQPQKQPAHILMQTAAPKPIGMPQKKQYVPFTHSGEIDA
jgi:hypothetical protein